MTHRQRLGIVALTCLLSLVIPGPRAVGQPAVPNPRNIRATVQKSLVYLRIWREGDNKGSELAGQGTGFVVTDADERKWIVTTSHGFWTSDAKKPVVSVTYRLPNAEKYSPCKSILLDEKHDVAMLSPSRVAPP
jgi:hypothetical protein